MCGITGVWNFNSELIDKKNFEIFTNSIKHRGPDHLGLHFNTNKNIALGHRRLAIIDLEVSSNQPFRYKDYPYLICYNGEVFNYLEIRRELEILGYHFNTDSDTEVVLVAFIEWGKNCLDKFNGMWAFSIWNEIKEEFFISRDRFGIKPFYYSFENKKSFIFASETIAFKNYSPFKRKINNSNFLRTINQPNVLEGTGYTIFEDVYQLLPGHYIEVNRNTRKVTQKKWWNSFQENITKKYSDQVSAFKSLFVDSCLLRLRSDVKIGTALSGGVDSSSIYCMLHHLKNTNLITSHNNINPSWKQAFIATFPGTNIDESRYAQEVISYTNGNANYIKPDFTNLIDDVVNSTKLFDSITGTPINIVSSIYKEMRKFDIKVSIDGHGVDELMYGYKSNVQEAFFSSLILDEKKYSEDLADIYVNMFDLKDQSRVKTSLNKKENEILNFNEKINNEHLLKKYLKKFYHLFDKNHVIPSIKISELLGGGRLNSLPSLSDKPLDFSNLSPSEKSLAMSFHLYDIPYNLRDFDRASMQQSVEVRMPFMDWRIVNFCFSLPTDSKLSNGFTKKILRDSMKGIMPENIRTRKSKIGLSAPLESWLINDLKKLVLDEFNSTSFLHSSHWDGVKLNKYFTSKYKNNDFNKKDYNMLWNILNAHLIIND